MEVRSIEITKPVAVIATALSLLLHIGSPAGVNAKSQRMRSKASDHHSHDQKVVRTRHHRQIAQSTPTDNVGPAGIDESLLKFQDHDPEKPAPPPPDSPPRTPFAINQDVSLVNVLKNVSSSMGNPSALNLPENEQIVVGLARQILDQALRQLESSGQGVASGSANTKLWNSPHAKLSDRFGGSVAAIWRKKNDGMVTVTISGECSDNTVIEGKKIGEFIVSIEARSTADLVDENKWIANVSKVSVDADCCHGVVEVTQEKKEEPSKQSAQEKRKEEEKKAKLPDSFFEYEKPGKERNVESQPPLVVAPSTPTVDSKNDTTTVDAPPEVAPQTTKPAEPVAIPSVVEAAKDVVPPQPTSVVEPPQNASPVASTNPDDKILTSFRRNQYLDVRAFQEQQKSQPKQELPWTEHTDNEKSAEKSESAKGEPAKKESGSKSTKRSSSKKNTKRLTEIVTEPEQPEIQGEPPPEDDDDKYGVKQAEKEAAEEEAAAKKAEKAERKKQKKDKSEDQEGQFVDKAIKKQEKESEKEAARAEKEAAKAQKKAEKKKAKESESDEPKKTSIEDLFNQDLPVGDEFMDTKKVERMEKMARTIAAKKGAKVSKETNSDKADDLLAQALAEEQGTPVDSGETKNSDEGIPDTFAAEKSTHNASPRKLFDRLDPDEEITPSAPDEKKPEMTFEERIKQANRPEGVEAVSGASPDSTTTGAFSGVSLRDPIADLGGPSASTGADPISRSDEAIPPAAQPAPESAIEGWNRIRMPEAVSTAEAIDNTTDRLIASNTARVRGKGGSIASKLFAQESAFSPNNLLSSRPVFNSIVPSSVNSLGTMFDGNSKTSSAKRPGLDAIIVMPERAVAGENLTVAVLEKKNQPEHAIELNFNGAPLATDSKGQAQYHVPDDATPGKTLLLSVTGRPELRCIEVIQPLSAPSSSRPSIDNISKLVVAGSVVTINGHNFSGIAADNKVTIDNRDAEVVAASPLQLKVSLPADLLPGTHSIGIKNDRDNHDSFDYVTSEVKLDGAKRSHLIVRISGTVQPVHVRLTNRTPDLIQMDQGDNVLVTTSGGKYNSFSVAVRQVKKDFKVDAEIEI